MKVDGGYRAQGLMLLAKLLRTKDPPEGGSEDQRGQPALKKVLTTLDLTSLGVGSCVGTGMYLVAGMVARNVAGPSVILSFVIAAVASIFSGVCYAEFGVRVPNTTGGAYMYSYVTVGELMAFIIGWNMILEELIGTAACACALSACFDAMLGGAINSTMSNVFGTVMGRPPDVVAFLLTALTGAVLITGVKKSTTFNNTLNSLNFCIWVFMMIAGLFYVDTTNWTEHGGFMPTGVSGVLTGAATCFYAFIGFDIIATTGEEAINPVKSIPRAIVLSLIIILIAYVSSSALVTLMVPYTEVDPDAALVKAFEAVNAPICSRVVAIGALAGLTVSMFGTMFSLPRIVYAMAKDGLIFRTLAGVWSSTGTPAVATVVFGLGSALAALFFPLTMLVEMMSIGTLLAYTLVSTCVLVLRYQPHSKSLVELLPQAIRTPMAGTPALGSPTEESRQGSSLTGGVDGAVTANQLQTALQRAGGRLTPTGLPQDQRVTVKKVTRAPSDSDDDDDASIDSTASRKEDDYMVGGANDAQHRYYGAVPSGTQRQQPLHRRIIDVFWQTLPFFLPIPAEGPCTEETGRAVAKLVGLLYLNIIVLDVTLVLALEELEGHSIAMCLLVFVFFVGVLVIVILISKHPQNTKALPFLAPCLPWVPAVAILVNVYLILKLNILSLVRFIVWMIIGLGIYFYYGINQSTVDGETEQFTLRVTSPGHSSQSSIKTSLIPNKANLHISNDTNSKKKKVVSKNGVAISARTDAPRRPPPPSTDMPVRPPPPSTDMPVRPPPPNVSPNPSEEPVMRNPFH